MTGGALPAHRRGGEQAASTKLDTRAHIGNVSVTHFNWTPGIGDPTIGGWVTVALYLLASGKLLDFGAEAWAGRYPEVE